MTFCDAGKVFVEMGYIQDLIKITPISWSVGLITSITIDDSYTSQFTVLSDVIGVY